MYAIHALESTAILSRNLVPSMTTPILLIVTTSRFSPVDILKGHLHTFLTPQYVALNDDMSRAHFTPSETALAKIGGNVFKNNFVRTGSMQFPD